MTPGHFFRRLWHNAHELGPVYYAYSLVAALTSAAYTIYKQVSMPMSGATEWSFWAFVFGISLTALIAPIVGWVLLKRLFRASGDEVANPYLLILRRDVAYSIKKGHLIKAQSLRLEALDSAHSFKLSVAVTGVCSAKVTVTSPGCSLKGPFMKGANDHYEVLFPMTLSKGQTINISFDIEVDDPQQTMRTFLSERFHNAAGYGEFSARYLFEQLPVTIKREKLSVSGETLETTEMLHTRTAEGRFLYDFCITKVDTHCVYTVSWVW